MNERMVGRTDVTVGRTDNRQIKNKTFIINCSINMMASLYLYDGSNLSNVYLKNYYAKST
jgi:hypothetical protein